MAVVLTPLPIHIPIVPRQPSNGGGASMTQVIHALAGVFCLHGQDSDICFNPDHEVTATEHRSAYLTKHAWFSPRVSAPRESFDPGGERDNLC
jgi:hypothetical protein